MHQWIDCMQFFYIIFSVLVKYHDVNNKHYRFIKDFSEFTTSVPCGCIS